MRGFWILIIFLIFLTFISCANQMQNEDVDELKFYALRHIEGQSEWILDTEPLFTGGDIKSYIWETHTIVFKKEFLENRVVSRDDDDFIMKGSKLLNLYYPDKFAVYLFDREIYVGYVEPQAFISFYPGGPVLSDCDDIDGLTIKCLINEEDTRSNQELKDFLILTKLLEKY